MSQSLVMDAPIGFRLGALPTALNRNGPALSTKSAANNGRTKGDVMIEIPAECDRVLVIWASYKRREAGAVTLGYPRHSAGFSSGGASTEDSFEELVERADRRTGAISDAILSEMELHGYQRQVMAIWNRYLGDVARFRGDPGEMLVDGCAVFLIEARRRGIAV